MSGSQHLPNIETTNEANPDSSLFSQLWNLFTGFFLSNNERSEPSDNFSNTYNRTDNHIEYENNSVFSDEESESESLSGEDCSTDELLENAVQNYFFEIENEDTINENDYDEYYMEDMRSVTFRFYKYGKNQIDNGPYNYATISAQSIMSQTPLKCTRYLYKYEDIYYDVISNGYHGKVIGKVDF